MAVGQQPSQAGVNVELSDLALQWRALCTLTRQKQEEYVNLGLTGLEAIGFTSADAQSVLTDMGYMATLAGCYFGTVQQGGSGGTGASQFNFDNALSGLWADQ